MRHLLTLFLLLNFHLQIFSQENSKLIEAFLSIPQPRLNQYSSIIINPKDLIDTLFNALPQADRINITRQFYDEMLIGSVKTDKPGKYSIGAMHFSLNQTGYYMKEINYEVIDTLPGTDKGLWIRRIIINDSIFCLIIEQRIPCKNTPGGKPTQYPTFEDLLQKTLFDPAQYEKDLMFIVSQNSNIINTLIIDGIEKSFLYSETYNFIRIANKLAKITLTKDNFIKLPGDYNFQSITIQ